VIEKLCTELNATETRFPRKNGMNKSPIKRYGLRLCRLIAAAVYESENELRNFS
jgi:hypothetical protein